MKSPWRLVNDGTAFGTAPFHLVVEGSAWIETPELGEIYLQAGDILMVSHGTPHILHCGDKQAPLAHIMPAKVTALGTLKSYGNGQKTEVLCGEFIFDPKISQLLIQSLPEVALLRTHGTNTHWQLYQLLYMLNKETQSETPGSRAITEHLSAALFSLLIRGLILENKITPGLLGLFTEPRLYPALESFSTKPNKALRLNELASICNMSRATFIRIVQQRTGHSPAQLFTSIRMMQSIKLLAKTSLSISCVSEKVGYASEPAFHRAFKKHLGISPGEFRREHMRKLSS